MEFGHADLLVQPLVPADAAFQRLGAGRLVEVQLGLVAEQLIDLLVDAGEKGLELRQMSFVDSDGAADVDGNGMVRADDLVDLRGVGPYRFRHAVHLRGSRLGLRGIEPLWCLPAGKRNLLLPQQFQWLPPFDAGFLQIIDHAGQCLTGAEVWHDRAVDELLEGQFLAVQIEVAAFGLGPHQGGVEGVAGQPSAGELLRQLADPRRFQNVVESSAVAFGIIGQVL